MTDIQQEFLRLAVVEKLKYDEISKKLGLDRKVFSPWWNELKVERERLTEIRNKWQVKCPEIDFTTFKNWYENTDKKCYYCHITESEIQQLWDKHPDLTKRNRGKKLEIERLEPNKAYSEISNLTFSCYWCNNAKTDTFTKDEFEGIGKVIKTIWTNRLK